jgi:hypothetical protein
MGNDHSHADSNHRVNRQTISSPAESKDIPLFMPSIPDWNIHILRKLVNQNGTSKRSGSNKLGGGEGFQPEDILPRFAVSKRLRYARHIKT